MTKQFFHFVGVHALVGSGPILHAQPKTVQLELKSYLAGVNSPGYTHVEVSGNYVYAFDNDRTFRANNSRNIDIIEVSEAKNPQRVAHYETAEPVHDIAIEKDKPNCTTQSLLSEKFYGWGSIHQQPISCLLSFIPKHPL